MGHFYFNDYIINKSNLINNVSVIKQRLKKGVKFCAVVKADAYGVGLECVGKMLNDVVDEFAVANIMEGINLRRAGINKPILVLGAINFDCLNDYNCYNLRPVVNNVFEASKLSSLAQKPIMVEFGLNTGMNRFGFCDKTEIKTAVSKIFNNSNLCVYGVYSHLATKENDVDFIKSQAEKFNYFASLLSCEVGTLVKHISNTNAALNHKELNYDMVRCGFGMYGMNAENNLKPVVEIHSKIVHLQKVKSGETVGYDRTYAVNGEDKLIGVVPLGYFDGVNRRVSNRGSVLVKGENANIVGRVCMDSMMIDVTHIKDVSVGDEVVVLGECGNKKVSINDYANWAGTSEYEILTKFNKSRMNIVVKY